MKQELVQVKKTKTVNQAIKELGLTPSKYIASIDGNMVRKNSKILDGQTLKLIPVVAGG